MAFTYHIDPVRRVAMATVSGTVTGAELADATRTIYRDAAWGTGFDVMWDFRGLTELLIERDDMQALVDLDNDDQFRTLAAGGRDVFIVARELDYAMGRVYAAFAREGPRQSHLVRTLREAWATLGLEPPDDH
ncbi:MAG TPA: hypothetical protein VMF13_15510 [Luteitalea sp.]|nr:hypothetical protein [Luteitalea sp.]